MSTFFKSQLPKGPLWTHNFLTDPLSGAQIITERRSARTADTDHARAHPGVATRPAATNVTRLARAYRGGGRPSPEPAQGDPGDESPI